MEEIQAIQHIGSRGTERGAGECALPPHLTDVLDAATELTSDQRAHAADLLAKQVNTFPAPGTPITGRTEAVMHDIDTGSTRPIRCNPRKLSPKKIKIQQELVDKTLEEGQIEHSVSAWSAPTVLVTKKDGTTRFCVDYRRLNNNTKKDAFPLPHIDDSLNSLSGQSWFSTLDLASGYWQVRLSEDAKPKTAFATHSDNRPIRVAGRFGCLYSPVQGADWLDVLSVGGGPVGKDVGIGYIGDGFSQYQSSDAAPLTELQDLNKLLHIYSDCATGFYLIWTVNITVRISLSVEEVTSCCGELLLCQTMDGAASADDRSGVTFTAELCVPWDAPEAVVDIDSTELISLGSFPDKVGLFGRRKEAAVSRIMAGRDSRSVRFVVPDGRIVDRGYHDVTVVDMEEEREPMVVLSDMTRLRELWPVEVFDHMKWYQQDLELLRKSAKKDYQQTRPMPCRFCGKVIRVDMYRHVARLHLDLVQLWRCPIAWCTTWKGSPQDCLEHVRSGHDAPWVSKTASIEKYAPPWTVRRQLWTDSLRIEHSGISTDMLLFSEVGMPLTQHYRVYKGGLPHAVFRTDYLPRLRSLLPSPGGADTSPDDKCGVTLRRPHRLSRPKRLFPDSVAIRAPILTEYRQ